MQEVSHDRVLPISALDLPSLVRYSRDGAWSVRAQETGVSLAKVSRSARNRRPRQHKHLLASPEHPRHFVRGRGRERTKKPLYALDDAYNVLIKIFLLRKTPGLSSVLRGP